MDRRITRRDFCQGMAVAIGSLPLLALHPELHAANVADYPPALTGLRGSHPGSFETAHAVARAGHVFPVPRARTDDVYDLVVVGAGLSGLAAAFFYRQRFPGARILILDNHDDFGGHARRNEFRHDGRTLIGYGGSQSIDSPGTYSKVARGLLAALGVETDRFYDFFDLQFAERNGLRTGIFFDAERYGQNRLVLGGGTGWDPVPDDPESFVAAMPISGAARRSLLRLWGEHVDYLPHFSREQKIEYLRGTSYNQYLAGDVKIDPDAIELFHRRLETYWCLQTDSLSALEMYRQGYPGFAGLGLGRVDGIEEDEEPYIFHFPDGNASLARLLVRHLIPDVAPGHTMEDVVTARFDYGRLDDKHNAVRIRRRSTVVNVRQDDGHVDVTYVNGGESFRVRGRHAVLACYHSMIPYLCPDLPESQKQALRYQVKTPLVYTNVLLSNWRAFSRLGLLRAFCPASYYSSVDLDFPVSMGDYRYSSDPDQPVILHLARGYNAPNQGLAPAEQFRAGRRELLHTDFRTFEAETRRQLDHLLGSAGFDAARDIEAITVNRWPHGYSYEYVELFDPSWAPGEAPHEIARRPFGNVGIANSDAEAYAYLDAAVDAAHRAVTALGAQ